MIPGRNTLRYALATQAYHSNIVRIANPDLSGLDHLVATRQGLFGVDHATVRLIVYGAFYGLTVRDDCIYAFEACDRPHAATSRGRIVRLRRHDDRIVETAVVATGLDNGCHQIDIIDDRICVVDTYNQRVLRYRFDGGEPEILRPIDGGAVNDWAHGYAHMNSIIALGDEILLLLHNGADKTQRASEIVRLDRDWRPIDRAPVDGLGCHSFAVLENDAILTCGSFAGELISTDGVKIAVCDMMTRGLSVDATRILVGGSAFADRASRDSAQGAVFILDRSYRPLGTVSIPAPPMDIRRIDGRDRSLSGHIAMLARQQQVDVPGPDADHRSRNHVRSAG